MRTEAGTAEENSWWNNNQTGETCCQNSVKEAGVARPTDENDENEVAKHSRHQTNYKSTDHKIYANDKPEEGYEDMESESDNKSVYPPITLRHFPDKVIPLIRTCTTIEEFTTFNRKNHGTFALEVLQHERKMTYETSTVVHDIENHQPTEPATETIIVADRIRINSRAVLEELSKSNPSAHFIHEQPTTFIHPFRFLIYSEARLKAKLKEMERNLRERSTQDSTAEQQNPFHDSDGTSNIEDVLHSSDEAKEDSTRKDSFEQLRCYIRFLDTQVMPLYNRCRPQNLTPPEEIHYDDLSYLFEPGDLVYIPQNRVMVKYEDNSFLWHQPEQRIWRVLSTPLWPGSANSTESPQQVDDLWFRCFYIDYDGEDFGIIVREIKSDAKRQRQRGATVAVRDLPVFPIHYVKEWRSIMEQSISHGQAFKNFVNPENRYNFYHGWTMTRKPDGTDFKGDGVVVNEPVKLEHIESTVMVDFAEGFKRHPSWRPVLRTRSAPTHNMSYVPQSPTDNPLICEYTNDTGAGQPRLTARWQDNAVFDDGTTALQILDLLTGDSFIGKSSRSWSTAVPEGDDVALLPRSIIAYAIWNRSFVILDVRLLRTARADDGVDNFELLKIPERHKLLIEAMVKGHFDRKRDEMMNSLELAGQDLIRGKGKGIVILLHGAPGVGKSATAEVVAERFKRPLFPMTCGDLGTDSWQVEMNLNRIFHLAHLWDCVLLLDEADIFISQRDRFDLRRNALVSVFLRMLEYYNGILFLTSNRPGALDEAVKSRVHLSLEYRPLDRQQTLDIFDLDIQRLQKIKSQRFSARPEHRKLVVDRDRILQFARENFDRHHTSADGQPAAIGRWNGRQIRNAFLIAASLAHFEGDKKQEKNPDFPKMLDESHFNTVKETTDQYDQYRSRLLNSDDDALAFHSNERLPDYVDRTTPTPHNRRTEAQRVGASFHNQSNRVQNPAAQQVYSQAQQVGYSRTTNFETDPLAEGQQSPAAQHYSAQLSNLPSGFTRHP